MSAAISGFAGQLARLVPRRVSSLTLGYAAWTAAWFFLFLLFTFPHDLVVRHWTSQLAAESGWQIRYDDVWLRPWNGYHLAKARLIAPGKDTEPWVSTAEIVFSPSLFGRGGYPFHFSGSAYGGDFRGSVDASGAVELAWSDVRLSQITRLTSLLEGDWQGEVSGEGRLSGGRDLKTLEGRGKVGLKGGSLTHGKAQGFTIPDLHFATGEAEVELKGGRLEVRSLKLSGSEVDADLHGQLYLLNPGTMPVVNAALNVKPQPGAPAGFEPLLTLLNHNQKPPSGSYTFTVYGPLNSMRVR